MSGICFSIEELLGNQLAGEKKKDHRGEGDGGGSKEHRVIGAAVANRGGAREKDEITWKR